MTTIFDPAGSNPPNRFSSSIHTATTSTHYTKKCEETAKELVNTITTSLRPAKALWELWDAFFTAVISSTSHAPHLALLNALRAQRPTQRINISAGSINEQSLRSYTQSDGKLNWAELPLFDAQWRDVHDMLHHWRGWDGVRDSCDGSTISRLSRSGGEVYLRFSIFSALLLKKGREHYAAYTVWVFYACRDVLEREAGQPSQQLWALDVRVAATWVRDGGWALWKTDVEELRQGWAAALDYKTALWPREDGLTRERWQLWEERLRVLSTDKSLDEETRAVVQEACEVVESVLQET
jgi:hypothetical protein